MVETAVADTAEGERRAKALRRPQELVAFDALPREPDHADLHGDGFEGLDAAVAGLVARQVALVPHRAPDPDEERERDEESELRRRLRLALLREDVGREPEQDHRKHLHTSTCGEHDARLVVPAEVL